MRYMIALVFCSEAQVFLEIIDFMDGPDRS
jgi:hypothetical protein